MLYALIEIAVGMIWGCIPVLFVVFARRVLKRNPEMSKRRANIYFGTFVVGFLMLLFIAEVGLSNWVKSEFAPAAQLPSGLITLFLMLKLKLGKISFRDRSRGP